MYIYSWIVYIIIFIFFGLSMFIYVYIFMPLFSTLVLPPLEIP